MARAVRLWRMRVCGAYVFMVRAVFVARAVTAVFWGLRITRKPALLGELSPWATKGTEEHAIAPRNGNKKAPASIGGTGQAQYVNRAMDRRGDHQI